MRPPCRPRGTPRGGASRTRGTGASAPPLPRGSVARRPRARAPSRRRGRPRGTRRPRRRRGARRRAPSRGRIRERRQALLEVVEAARGREDERAVRDGAGEVPEGEGAGARQADAGDVRSATASGVGKTCVRPGRAAPFGSGRPHSTTSRPASVRAPATEICWPRTARTATSNGSHAPGTRRPGLRATSEARSGSAESTLAIARGSAERSKRREVRAVSSSGFAQRGNSNESECDRPRRRSAIRSVPGTAPLHESPFIGILSLFDPLDPGQRPCREEREEARGVEGRPDGQIGRRAGLASHAWRILSRIGKPHPRFPRMTGHSSKGRRFARENPVLVPRPSGFVPRGSSSPGRRTRPRRSRSRSTRSRTGCR